jgi:hypothetical protein
MGSAVYIAILTRSTTVFIVMVMVGMYVTNEILYVGDHILYIISIIVIHDTCGLNIRYSYVYINELLTMGHRTYSSYRCVPRCVLRQSVRACGMLIYTWSSVCVCLPWTWT